MLLAGDRAPLDGVDGDGELYRMPELFICRKKLSEGQL